MSPSARTRRALSLCVAAALLATQGCSAGDDSTPMGWVETVDEQSDARFAMPPPVTGPENTELPGRSTPIGSRAWTSRVGDITFSVQVLSTPESPESLTREVPAERMPFVALDHVRAEEGDVDGRVLSNTRVDGADQPTYDAQVEVTSGEAEALWWMRSRELGDVVLVTQVVAFLEGDRAEMERQAENGFDRLNGTVELPG